VAGVKPGKLVEAHGSFTTASCTRCKSKQDPEEARVSATTVLYENMLHFVFLMAKQQAFLGLLVTWSRLVDWQLHSVLFTDVGCC